MLARFTTEIESRYAPTEGEALAVVRSLEHAKMFVLRCNDLIVIIAHYWESSTIAILVLWPTPRLQKFKGWTLWFQFSIQYCPGKWLCGLDARNPSTIASIDSTQSTFKTIRELPTKVDIILIAWYHQHSQCTDSNQFFPESN